MQADPMADRVIALRNEIRQLEAERAELQRTVEDLRGFEREYRTRLLAYLDDLTETLRMEGRP